MPNILDELSIKLSAQTSNVESALNDVARSIGSIVQELGNLKSVKVPVLVPAKTRDGLRDFADVISRLDMGRLGGFTNAMNELAGMSKLNLGISSKVTEGLFNFADVLKYMDINKLYMMGQTISSADFSNLKILGETARDLTKLYEQYNLLYQSQKKVAEAQSKVTINFSETRKEASKTAATVHKTTGIFSKFFASIKRIAFYRVIRSAIREITQGLAEGIENLYYWSQAVGTSFAPSMDRMATATLYLKNGFASMWSPLIERAIPVLDALIDKWVDFFNIVQEGFARLTGQATWNKALKYPVTYKDALNDASKAAKEFKNQLLGFDELNVLNTPSNSGRGSGSDLLDYSRMFELVETNMAADGKGIGAKLADAIAGAFADPDKWGDAGDKAAGFLGTAFDNTIDFFKEGHENGMFTRIGESMSQFFTKFATKLAEKIRDTNWPEAIDALTQAVCDIIDGIDLGEVLKALGKLIVSITFSIPGMVVASLGSALKLTASYIRMWAKAFGENSLIGAILMGSASSIEKGAERVNKIARKWDAMGDLATNVVFNAIDGKGLVATQEQLAEFEKEMSHLNGPNSHSGSSKNGIEIPITPTILEEQPKASVWWSAFTKTTWGTRIADIFTQIQNVRNDIETGWSRFKTIWGIRTAYATTAVQNIIRDIETGWSRFKTLWGLRYADVVTAVQTYWQDIQTGYSRFLTLWGTKKADVITAVQTFWNDVQNGWSFFKSYWGDRRADVWTQVRSAWTDVQNGWTVLKNYWGDKKVDAYTRITSTWTAISDGWKTLKDNWGDWRNLAVGIAVSFAQALSNAWNGIKDWWSRYTSSLTVTATVKTNHSGTVGGVKFAAGGFFAEGGYPTTGTLFWAGEGGVPEMLGTVNGHNAVAGGAEITGIREEIALQGQAERQMLAQLINAVVNKDLTLVANSATGKWVNKALKAYSGVTG